MAVERTFVMVKPDGVMRGLVGEVIMRLEKASFKLVGMKMAHPTTKRVEDFYPSTEDWMEKIGQKTKKRAKELGIDFKSAFGTDDDVEIGRQVKKWLVKFVSAGPVALMVWEGNNAVEKVRKLVGYTDPIGAEAGTVRGDLSQESIDWANWESRAVINVVHASGEPEEAEQEIAHWFTPGELFKYKHSFDLVMDKLRK
jgi:nucleoside-diphosphate kinase